jgi:hypothetical protein
MMMEKTTASMNASRRMPESVAESWRVAWNQTGSQSVTRSVFPLETR